LKQSSKEAWQLNGSFCIKFFTIVISTPRENAVTIQEGRGHRMAQRGQRGSLRIRSGSFVGYYNTYVIDGHGQKQRRQKAIVLCTIDAGKWQARRLLQEKIDSEFLGEKASAKPDPKMSLEQFTRERWLPMMEPRWRKYKTSDGSDFSSTQSAVETCFRHIFKRLGKTPLEELDAVMLQT
jgi:hypothetical protein